MDIAFNVDDKYVPHLCVVILSILEHVKDDTVVFHVLTSSLSLENRDYIASLIKDDRHNVVFYDVDNRILGQVTLGIKTANPSLTFAAFLRLAIPSVLPERIEKVLYLDCDIVIVDDLLPLWRTDVSNACIAACCEYNEEHSRRLGYYDESKMYFNSGVLLMNLKKMREFSFLEEAKSVICELGSKLKFHDQDVLNLLLHNSVVPMDEKWNKIWQTEMFPGLAVVHFAGIKPWNIECTHPLRHIYWEYLNQTKFAGMKPVHYYSKIERGKRFIKRILGICR